MAQQNPERKDKDTMTNQPDYTRKEIQDQQQPEKDVNNERNQQREKGEDRWKDSERNEQTAIDEEDEVV